MVCVIQLGNGPNDVDGQTEKASHLQKPNPSHKDKVLLKYSIFHLTFVKCLHAFSFILLDQYSADGYLYTMRLSKVETEISVSLLRLP